MKDIRISEIANGYLVADTTLMAVSGEFGGGQQKPEAMYCGDVDEAVAEVKRLLELPDQSVEKDAEEVAEEVVNETEKEIEEVPHEPESDSKE